MNRSRHEPPSSTCHPDPGNSKGWFSSWSDRAFARVVKDVFALQAVEKGEPPSLVLFWHPADSSDVLAEEFLVINGFCCAGPQYSTAGFAGRWQDARRSSAGHAFSGESTEMVSVTGAEMRLWSPHSPGRRPNSRDQAERDCAPPGVNSSASPAASPAASPVRKGAGGAAGAS